MIRRIRTHDDSREARPGYNPTKRVWVYDEPDRLGDVFFDTRREAREHGARIRFRRAAHRTLGAHP